MRVGTQQIMMETAKLLRSRSRRFLGNLMIPEQSGMSELGTCAELGCTTDDRSIQSPIRWAVFQYLLGSNYLLSALLHLLTM